MAESAQKKKIGIYSGSFNPIHIGHLALANWLCEFTDLEEVWFLVTPQNPFKQNMNLMDDQLRLELVREAVRGYAKFKVSDIEFSMPKPSYTINTLRTLSENNPDCSFQLIMGSDNWIKFNGWKNHDEILERHGVLVYPRKGYSFENHLNTPHVCFVNAPEMEISSTFIRESLASGKDVRFFLPANIWHYFAQKKGHAE